MRPPIDPVDPIVEAAALAPNAARPEPQSVAAAVPDLDPVAAQRWRSLERPASPWLHEEIGQRMAQRLDWLVQRPRTWASWHPALGGLQAQQAVQARYPEAQRQALNEQGQPQGQASSAALQPGQADLLWANMALHLYAQPQALLACWRNWLRPEGLLFFSGLGPDTLLELRRVYQALGWPPPHQPYTDMHDWGDMLVQAGFNAPVLDMERLTLSYPSAERLLQDLREGGRNLHLQRPLGLRGRAHRQRLLHALEQQLPRNADGHLCLTVEVVYGHALKAAPRVPVAASSTVALDDMRTLLRRPPRA
ncbi:methyltransferase domain-containing protein [Serpentinimonas barnesii]|uniref:methyltransferase domain-containing protein n=1 Tax=Serpentinimonas barnesii TaxID=1458427 RepID=UPI000B049213|nr:methyltransferase domain-containing protein [Serpentinimonas barnesii]